MAHKNPVRVAVVGYGYWAPKLIRNIRSNPSFALSVICEKDPTRHAQIRNEHPGLDITTSLSEALSCEGVEAVVIATGPSSHFSLAKQALEKGVHVLVEKPMTLHSQDGSTLLRLAEERNLALMVDHTYLYAPAIQALREKIRSNALGTVHAYESRRTNLGIFQHDTDVLWDLAPHDFSLLRYLFDERPSHVSVYGSDPIAHPRQRVRYASIAHITLFFSGFQAHLEVSWISPLKIRQVTVFGSVYTAQYDQLAEQSLTFMQNEIRPVEKGAVGAPLYEYTAGLPEPVALDIPAGEDDLARMLADFARCVRTGEEPLSNAILGNDVVHMLEAAAQSLKHGGKKMRISYASEKSLTARLRKAYNSHRYDH